MNAGGTPDVTVGTLEIILKPRGRAMSRLFATHQSDAPETQFGARKRLARVPAASGRSENLRPA
jgi:hypothetical protein